MESESDLELGRELDDPWAFCTGRGTPAEDGHNHQGEEDGLGEDGREVGDCLHGELNFYAVFPRRAGEGFSALPRTGGCQQGGRQPRKKSRTSFCVLLF